MRKERLLLVLRDVQTGQRVRVNEAAVLLGAKSSYQYHLFVSHVWTTGQDQAKAFKQVEAVQ